MPKDLEKKINDLRRKSKTLIKISDSVLFLKYISPIIGILLGYYVGTLEATENVENTIKLFLKSECDTLIICSPQRYHSIVENSLNKLKVEYIKERKYIKNYKEFDLVGKTPIIL